MALFGGICGIFEINFFLDDTPLIVLSLLLSLSPLSMALRVLAVPLSSSFLLKYLYNVVLLSPPAIYSVIMCDPHCPLRLNFPVLQLRPVPCLLGPQCP